MVNGLFSVDGVSYGVRVPVGGLKRSFKVLDGDNAGRLLNAAMTRDVLGTFYNYTLTINRDSASLEEYDQLFQTISSPVDYHIVSFPYGQDYLTFHAYITDGNDSLSRRRDGKQYWNDLTINFVAMEPQRRP